MLENRFKMISKESLNESTGWVDIFILKDTNTGVHYLYSEGSSRSTMTPLLGADGNPLIDKSE